MNQHNYDDTDVVSPLPQRVNSMILRMRCASVWECGEKCRQEEKKEEEEKEEEEYRTHSTLWCSFPPVRAWYPSVQLPLAGWMEALPGRPAASSHQLADQPPPRCQNNSRCTATGATASNQNQMQVSQLIVSDKCTSGWERERGSAGRESGWFGRCWWWWWGELVWIVITWTQRWGRDFNTDSALSCSHQVAAIICLHQSGQHFGFICWNLIPNIPNWWASYFKKRGT